MIRFLAWFFGLLLVLFLAELTAPVQRLVVVPWTTLLAHTSAFLVQLFDSSVASHGRVMHNVRTGAGISIEAGCNGIEACIVLTAALMAYKADLAAKLKGLVAGILAIQAVNVLRVISLYYLVQWNAQVFEFAHLYLWQALIMLDVVVVWLLWLRWVTGRSFAQDTPARAA